MNPMQQSAMAAGFRRLFAMASGDGYVWVDGNGNETPLRAMEWDVETESAEGVESDAAGVRDQAERYLTLLREELEEHGVEISGSGHFMIRSERWDLKEGEPIGTKQVAPASWNGFVKVRVRCSVELNETVPGDGFTFG